jgi:hypothetical protein
MGKNGNLISKIVLFGMILLFITSCRTAYYAPTNVYDKKLPALNPEIDWLSIETNFRDGTTYSTSTSYGSSSVTYNPSAAYGNNTGIGANSQSVTRSASTYVKNPQIKYLRDVFIKETFNVSEQFGKQQGSIVWSVGFYNRYQKGAGASKALLILTLGTGAIFHLMGVPWCSYTGIFSVKADIFDKDKNYVASYSSGKKYVKYYVAMWWGYSGSSARSMAFSNPLYQAINEVKSKIMNDSNKITEQLNK